MRYTAGKHCIIIFSPLTFTISWVDMNNLEMSVKDFRRQFNYRQIPTFPEGLQTELSFVLRHLLVSDYFLEISEDSHRRSGKIQRQLAIIQHYLWPSITEIGVELEKKFASSIFDCLR